MDFEADGLPPSQSVRAAARVVNQSRRFPVSLLACCRMPSISWTERSAMMD